MPWRAKVSARKRAPSRISRPRCSASATEGAPSAPRVTELPSPSFSALAREWIRPPIADSQSKPRGADWRREARPLAGAPTRALVVRRQGLRGEGPARRVLPGEDDAQAARALTGHIRREQVSRPRRHVDPRADGPPTRADVQSRPWEPLDPTDIVE